MTTEIGNTARTPFSAVTAGIARPAGADEVDVRNGIPDEPNLTKRLRLGEAVLYVVLAFCGIFSILVTISLVVVLVFETWTFFQHPEVSIVEFFTGTIWQPMLGVFGMLPLLNATLMSSAIAMLFALPLGLFAAILLSEYASPRVRSTLKPILELLASVPTVVFGYFALTFMTPLLRTTLDPLLAFFGTSVQVYNVAAAGIVIGILVIPVVASLSEDALHAVPTALREASFGIGATRLETITRIVLPAALSGLTAAFIVAMSRAVGETMVVAIAAGAGPNLTFNPFLPAETITGHIARISGGDLSYDSIDYQAIFALALLLFLMTLALNVFSRWMMRRFREEY